MYEVKGKCDEVGMYFVAENAIDVIEASNNAMGAGMGEIFAVYLSKVKEVFRDHIVDANDDAPRHWYKVTVGDVQINESNGKKKVVKYPILVQATSLDEANSRIDEILSQGYNMIKVKIETTKIDAVI